METNIRVKGFIPQDLISGRISGREKNIPNTQKTGFYRYYGIYKEEKQIGEVSFSIEFNKETFDLCNIEIINKYRNQGYGTILLNESIRDCVRDIPYSDKVNVCSLPKPISFYRKNGFNAYFGDNNLTRLVGTLRFDQSDLNSYQNIRNKEKLRTEWYQRNALRMLNDFKSPEMRKLNAYMGIIGEYGEFFDYIKNYIRII